MRSGPNQFDSTLPGPAIRCGADERRQERVVDVDHRATHVGEETRGENLHVAREHHQIDIAPQHVEHPRFRLGADVPVRGDVDEGDTERPDLVGEVSVIGDHHHHRHVELTPAVTPQQIQEAVILARGQDGHPLGSRGVGEPKIDGKRLGDLAGEPVA
jgi:hypothetical protein